MIAIDTNLLIYAHRSGTKEHQAARAAIEKAASMRDGFAITLPSVTEFFSIVTHPSASGRPSSPEEAAGFLRALEQGGMTVLGPGPAFAGRLLQTAVDLGVSGPRVFDLQIALCALDGGATELWTHDRRFVKMPGLMIHDPIG
jgi:toxin-antitoxin system PIN domain toxin